jgi:NAD(P)H-flavin reductase
VTFRSRWVLFSGSHGISAPVGEYESVFMVATGFGMAALLSYLQQLISGYQTRKVCTRQIRLIWQVQRIGKYAQGMNIH